MRRGGDIAWKLQTDSGNALHYIMLLQVYKDTNDTLICLCVFCLVTITYSCPVYENKFIRICGKGQGIKTLFNFFVSINVL